MKKIYILLIIFTAIAANVNAGSIYAKRHREAQALYSDDTARHVGDLITIIINEDSKSDNTVERTLENTNNRSNSFNGELGVNFIPDLPGFTMSQKGERKLDGKSEYDDQRKYTDKITVVVQDIHPNGNLVVLGYRERDISGDKHTIQISGIIRPSDVLFDNTIGSQKVANFKLITISDGVSEDYNKPGWFAQILDMFWPF